MLWQRYFLDGLIVSTAAGLVVTRAASESNMGTTVGKQIFLQPKAMGVAAAMLIVFGLIPGMPIMPFLILSGLTGFGAWSASKAIKRTAAQVVESKQINPEEAFFWVEFCIRWGGLSVILCWG